MKKLHIGCGKVHLHGFLNVDIFSHVGADLCCDITRLPFQPRSFDLIYASHVLEHIHRHMVLATLQHWRDILSPSGVLRLAVPDFAAICEHYQENKNLAILMGLLYGGQNYAKNSHTVIFDKSMMVDLLKQAGFSEVREWDWRKTEHAAFDDFSQAFLPHMDKENGRLMSLNLEGLK